MPILLDGKGTRIANAISNLADVMYKITDIVMKFSPIGVCALPADSIGTYGLDIFWPLGKLILPIYASDVVIIFALYVPMPVFFACFPQKRYQTADEYARSVVFICSPANSTISGQVICVDGAMTTAY